MRKISLALRKMFQITLSIFLVILLGYIFGRRNKVSAEAEGFINTYVLYIALPALLFLALAKSDKDSLLQWEFLAASLGGIFFAYIAGILWGIFRGIRAPHSAIIGMSASYGTTGYMGIPVLIAIYGSGAAVPAAISTILHNIPVIMTVIITFGLFSANGAKNVKETILSASKVIITNPLSLAVIFGIFFALLEIPLPKSIELLCDFMGAAAGPTALFALGLGLAKLKVPYAKAWLTTFQLLPVIAIKILLLPVFTVVLFNLFADITQENFIWYATAVVMSAQPIGAGVYVFAAKFDCYKDEVSLAILTSLLIATITLPLVLYGLHTYGFSSQ